jgi:hypothetical protein
MAKKMSYRLEAEATVCFSIDAKSQQEAIAKARDLLLNVCDGIKADIHDDDGNDLNGRLYFTFDGDDNAEVGVVDVDHRDAFRHEDAVGEIAVDPPKKRRRKR